MSGRGSAHLGGVGLLRGKPLALPAPPAPALASEQLGPEAGAGGCRDLDLVLMCTSRICRSFSHFKILGPRLHYCTTQNHSGNLLVHSVALQIPTS